MKTIAAGKFKATCLALLDEVHDKREPITVTKNGTPVARLVPLEIDDDPLAIFRYPGIQILGDVLAPLYSDEELDEFERELDEEVRGTEE